MAKITHNCCVCKHPERYRIERLRAGGASCESLGRKFDLHRDAIWRHWRLHVSDGTKAQLLAGLSIHDLAKRAEAEGMALMDYLGLLRGVLTRMFMAAAEASDRQGVAVLSSRLLECLREIGRLTGEIAKIGHGNTTITNNVAVFNSPAFAQAEMAILSALGPYPEARVAVVAALRSIQPETSLSIEAPKVVEGSYVSAA